MSAEEALLRAIFQEPDEGIVCARCDKATGNNSQGHYWKWCKVTRDYREFHFCCPDACELEA